MPAPWNNLRSKLDRAICAFLTSQGTGSVVDIVPTVKGTIAQFPITIVHSTVLRPYPVMTGDYRGEVHISIRGSAVLAQTEPNLDRGRIDFDKRIAQTMDALMQTNDNATLVYTAQQITLAGQAMAVAADASPAAIAFAANNADMADFTCINWFDGGFGDGQPDESGCNWEEILIFDAICCGNALS